MLNAINNHMNTLQAAADSTAAKKTDPEKGTNAAKEADDAKRSDNAKEADNAKKGDSPGKTARRQDEYIPEKKQPTPGLYRKDGKKDSEEEVIGSTDKVDAEIKKLKEKKAKLEQEISRAQNDPEKLEKLQKQLNQVENELRVKDTDSYRRRHMQVTRRKSE